MSKNEKTKKLCLIAMLIAITALLSYISGFLRIGNAVKISVTFISIYMAAVFYGPLAGGFVAAVGDVLSHFINPVGMFLPGLTIIEFLSGLTFGLFKRNGKEIKNTKTKIAICVMINFLLNLFPKTYVLMTAGYVPSDYSVALLSRLLSSGVMLLIQAIMLYVFETIYTDKFFNLNTK